MDGDGPPRHREHRERQRLLTPFPSRSLCPLCLRGSMPFAFHLAIRSASDKILSASSAGCQSDVAMVGNRRESGRIQRPKDRPSGLCCYATIRHAVILKILSIEPIAKVRPASCSADDSGLGLGLMAASGPLMRLFSPKCPRISSKLEAGLVHPHRRATGTPEVRSQPSASTDHVTSFNSWSANRARVPNMMCAWTLQCPRTRTCRPPKLSLSRL